MFLLGHRGRLCAWTALLRVSLPTGGSIIADGPVSKTSNNHHNNSNKKKDDKSTPIPSVSHNKSIPMSFEEKKNASTAACNLLLQKLHSPSPTSNDTTPPPPSATSASNSKMLTNEGGRLLSVLQRKENRVNTPSTTVSTTTSSTASASTISETQIVAASSPIRTTDTNDDHSKEDSISLEQTSLAPEVVNNTIIPTPGLGSGSPPSIITPPLPPTSFSFPIHVLPHMMPYGPPIG